MCNSWTEAEVFQRRIFGLPNTAEYVAALNSLSEEGSVLFLFNLTTRLLYGVFSPNGKAEVDSQSGAFRNKFRLHQSFTIRSKMNRTFTLAETNFPPFLKETTNRCMGLTALQAHQLIGLMDPWNVLQLQHYPYYLQLQQLASLQPSVVCTPGVVTSTEQQGTAQGQAQGWRYPTTSIYNWANAAKSLANPMCPQIAGNINLSLLNASTTPTATTGNWAPGVVWPTGATNRESKDKSGPPSVPSPPVIARRKFTNSKKKPESSWRDKFCNES